MTRKWWQILVSYQIFYPVQDKTSKNFLLQIQHKSHKKPKWAHTVPNKPAIQFLSCSTALNVMISLHEIPNPPILQCGQEYNKTSFYEVLPSFSKHGWCSIGKAINTAEHPWSETKRAKRNVLNLLFHLTSVKQTDAEGGGVKTAKTSMCYHKPKLDSFKEF